MTITATYQENGAIFVVRQYQTEDEDGNPVIRTEHKTVPDDMANRDRRRLAEWEASGGVIAPYVPPTPPTEAALDAQEMEKVQLGSIDRAFFELLFEMANQIRVLQGKAELTKAQFANYAKTKLRS